MIKRSARRRARAGGYVPPHRRYARGRGGFLGRFFRAAILPVFRAPRSILKRKPKARHIAITPGGSGSGTAAFTPGGGGTAAFTPGGSGNGTAAFSPGATAYSPAGTASFSPGGYAASSPLAMRAVSSPLWRVADILLGMLVLGGLLFMGWALLYSDTSFMVTYSEAGVTHHIRTKAATVREFMAANGFSLDTRETLSLSLDEPLTPGMAIYVTRAFPVAVASGDEVRVLHMRGGNVSEALNLAGVSYDADDELTKLPFEDVAPGMHIQHIDVKVEYETKDQTIEYKEQVIKDKSRYMGDDRVKTEGEDGEKRIVRRLIYRDGELYSREIINQLILKEAVDKVVITGTKVRYQTSLTGDERLWKAKPTDKEIAKTIVATEVTAYTHTGNRTATGRWPKIGYVAVNPKVIPYGTKMYIPGYGYCTAQDTGAFRFEEGGMKNQIDVFMNTEKECKKWGRKKNIKIYILK